MTKPDDGSTHLIMVKKVTLNYHPWESNSNNQMHTRSKELSMHTKLKGHITNRLNGRLGHHQLLDLVLLRT